MAMSFARPVAADFSIREFARRGEENADGWGLAWYPDESVAIVKEPVKWQSSPYSTFLESYRGLRSRLYIAHVRLKTIGGARPTHADTHPFVRELAGREYTFAHNGTLSRELWQLSIDRYRPVGGTDSEYLFCHLLALIADWPDQLGTVESWPKLQRKLAELNTLGKLNILLCDGQRLLCYHDAGGWKGLVYRQIQIRRDEGRHFEDSTIQIELGGDPVNFGVVIATSPLSPTGWTHMQKGELLVMEEGKVRYSSHRAAMDGKSKGPLVDGAKVASAAPRQPTS